MSFQTLGETENLSTSWHPPPVQAPLLRALSLGDPVTAAKLMSLWLQGFDVYEGDFMRLTPAQYQRLTQWMEHILTLDPNSQYLLLLASRVYAESPQTEQQRHFLEFVYQQFFIDPKQRWRWLLQVTMLARHRLHDDALALRYAQALAEQVPRVPMQAASIYLFLLDEQTQFDRVRSLFSRWDTAGYIEAEERQLLMTQLQALQVR